MASKSSRLRGNKNKIAGTCPWGFAIVANQVNLHLKFRKNKKVERKCKKTLLTTTYSQLAKCLHMFKKK